MKANAGGPGSIPGQGTRCHNLKEKKMSSAATKTQSYGLCGRGRGWEDLGEWH